MSGFINVTALGNVGKDPEIRSTGSGKKVANFVIAVDQGFGENKKVEWVNVLAWEKLADIAEKYLKKGKTIIVNGTLQTTSWDDKQSGQKRYKTEVVAREIVFVDTRAKEDDGMDQRPARSERAIPASRERQPAPPRHDSMDPFSIDEDVPF